MYIYMYMELFPYLKSLEDTVIISQFCLICFSPGSGQCETGWTRYGDNCYHFSHDTETFADALVSSLTL